MNDERGTMNISPFMGNSLFLFLALTLLAGGAEAARFESKSIKPGGQISGVVFRDFDGDRKPDLIVNSRRRTGSGAMQRYLTIYSGAGTANSRGSTQEAILREYEVPDDAVAFGVGDLLGEGRSQIVYFTSRSVVAIASESSRPVRLIDSQRFFFNLPMKNALPHWDYIRDVNGDGRDDLILADARGYRVYLQTPDHAFDEAGRVEGDFSFATQSTYSMFAERRGRTTASVGESNVPRRDSSNPRTEWARPGNTVWASSPIVTRRSMGRLGIGDLNGDERLDLITLKGNKLRAHFQSPEGRFSDEPDQVFALGPKQESNAWDDRRFPIAHGDVNADGRIDFVVSEIDVKDLATKFRLYLWKEEGISSTPDQVLKLSGLGSRIALIDVNGDGYRDLAYPTIRADKMLQSLSTSVKELDATYYVYLYDPSEGHFSRRPSIKWGATLAVTPNMEEEQEVLVPRGDFNGDGVLDIAIHQNKGELLVYACTANKRDKMKLKVASKPMLRQKVPFPLDFSVVDLDGDGLSDAVLRYKDRLEVLITR